MKRNKLIFLTLILCLILTMTGCGLDLSKLNLGALLPSSSAPPSPTEPDTSPAFPSATPTTRPEFSDDTSVTCPDGHELVYHEARANCISDGWDEYVTCKNCTEYSTQVIKPMIGSHDLTCPLDVCPGAWHVALHTCAECGFGMVAKPENRYYVSKLTQTQYDVYCDIYNAIMNFEPEIEIEAGLLTREEWTSVVMWALSYDSPELMQIESSWHSSTLTVGGETYVVKVVPTYQMTESTYRSAMLLVANTFADWQTEMLGKSDYEIELFVHDQITANTTYSASADYSNCTYGVLHDKLSRCEGFSKTMTWAMWGFSIPCASIVGEAGGEAHSWNAVRIDGEFTFVDITWDLGNSFSHHDYFNVNEEILLTTHEIHEDFVAMGYPECTTMDSNYAVKNDLYFTEEDEALLEDKLYAELDKAYHDTDYVIELRFESNERADANVDTVSGIISDWANDRRVGISYRTSRGSNSQIMISLE